MRIYPHKTNKDTKYILAIRNAEGTPIPKRKRATDDDNPITIPSTPLASTDKDTHAQSHTSEPHNHANTLANKQREGQNTRKRTTHHVNTTEENVTEHRDDGTTSSGRHPLPHGRGETDVSLEASGVGQPRDRQKIKRQKWTTNRREREEDRSSQEKNHATTEMEEHTRIRKSREKWY